MKKGKSLIKVPLFLTIFLPCMVYFMTGYGQEKLHEQAKKLVTTKTGVVVCTVIDESEQALEYATVAVISIKDSSVITGSITNSKGVCTISNIPWGNYLIRIGYIGYKDIYSGPVSISSSSPVANLNRQQMKLGSSQIEGVTISAQKDMLQTNLDKKVFNVDQSIASEGVTGLEVLENIPSVSVDLEGNISLRGSESVTILVDGRPTNLTLDQIPSSMIESVELITNPSARFDPDGVSGIINVVLKKKKESGFNGMITLGTGISNLEDKFYWGTQNASASINYRYNKINLFANYDFRSRGRNNTGTLERESVFNNDTTILNQNSLSNSRGYSHNLRTGFDYFINKQNTLSFNVSYNPHNSISHSETDSKSQTGSSDAFNKIYKLDNDWTNANQNIGANLFYKHEFQKKGQELSVDVYYSHRWGNKINYSMEDYSQPANREDFYNLEKTDARNQYTTAQIDFVTPIGNGGRIETGYKLLIRNTFQDYIQETGNAADNLTEVPSDANNYNYNEYINAAYFIYSNTIKEKFKYQVGLRGELADNMFNLNKLDTSTRSFYPNIFPTVHLVYDFNKKHSLSLSYSMRVRRPNIFQLNPYVNNSDRFNLSKGNPNLKPELTNSVDLSYQYFTEKTTVTASVFYRHRYQMISRYTELLNDSVSMTSYQNFDQAQSYGMELYYAQTLFKWWKTNISGSFYQTLIDSKQEMIDPNLMDDWSWNVRGTFNFILPKDLDLQLTANYRSPIITTGSMSGFGWGGGSGQGRMEQQWNLDLGIKKLFLKKTLTLTIRINDIFATQNHKVHTFGSDDKSSFDAYSYRKNDRRSLFVSLSYKINNYRPKKDTHQGEGNDLFEE